MVFMNKISSLSLKEVSITGRFWGDFIEKVRTHVIPYQWKALNDAIPGVTPSYCMHNFRVAAGKEEGKFGGCVFQDSDVAKWLEAVGYILMQHPDAELEKLADSAIDDIVAAQQPDGYLDTYYIINGLEKRFTNLKDNHELYCLGHFLEGAVAYYQATGKDKLLNALIRYVDLVDRLIGSEEGKIHGYPGHEEMELALMKLYSITKDEKHLKLAKYFIDERGKEPLFFREETEKNDNKFHWEKSPLSYHYYQAGKPVREQQHAVGHAVRAVYLYSGMADVAVETGDQSLIDACKRLWDDVTNRQMYITGAIGSSAHGEAFTFDYDLPNDTIYAETCASIGLCFFAKRMMDMECSAQYADVLERSLYNGVIAAMSYDGTSFFYVNPLEVVPEASEKDYLRHHVKVTRQKWFGCACCPPNIARFLASFGNYIFSKSGDTFYVHLFVESKTATELKSGTFALDIQTNYPWENTILMKVKTAPSSSARIAIRIPGWCEGYKLRINGKTVQTPVENGYAMMEQVFRKEDEIELILDMPVTIVEANPRVREDIGKLAVMRGPLVYCLEEADNGKDLHRIYIERNTAFRHEYDRTFFGGAVILESDGKRLSQEEWGADSLYRKVSEPKFEDVRLKWIPYYLWANRESGEMTVWVRRK